MTTLLPSSVGVKDMLRSDGLNEVISVFVQNILDVICQSLSWTSPLSVIWLKQDFIRNTQIQDFVYYCKQERERMVISQLVFLALDRASSNKGGKLGSSATRLVPEQNVQIKKKRATHKTEYL